jgi:acetate kinase
VKPSLLVLDAGGRQPIAALLTADNGRSPMWSGPLGALPPADVTAVVQRFVHAPDEVGEVADHVDEAALAAAGALEPWDTAPRLAAWREAQAKWLGVPQRLVFDTPFFRALPAAARTYALPPELAEAHGLYRRGRHGPVHRLAAPPGRCVSVVVAETVSVAALLDGQPREVSAGATALEGVPGAHTVGDIDPAAVLYLVDSLGLSLEAVEQALVADGGLEGVADAADPDFAQRLLVHRLRRYIGAYAAVLGGLDHLVFSGADDALRSRVTAGLAYLGCGSTVSVVGSSWTPLTAAAMVAS